jgi:hypothetical protein
VTTPDRNSIRSLSPRSVWPWHRGRQPRRERDGRDYPSRLPPPQQESGFRLWRRRRASRRNVDFYRPNTQQFASRRYKPIRVRNLHLENVLGDDPTNTQQRNEAASRGVGHCWVPTQQPFPRKPRKTSRLPKTQAGCWVLGRGRAASTWPAAGLASGRRRGRMGRWRRRKAGWGWSSLAARKALGG